MKNGFDPAQTNALFGDKERTEAPTQTKVTKLEVQQFKGATLQTLKQIKRLKVQWLSSFQW